MARARLPQRVPKQPTTSTNERVGAGCLGLMVLPWFFSTLFGAFVSAGLPMEGLMGIFAGGFSLVFMVPMLIVLGSVSMSALSRAMGSNQKITITHRAASAVGVSTIGIFLLASFVSIIGTGLPAVLGGVGLLLLVTAIGNAVRRERKAHKPERERRRHKGPPKPPWQHPLARTEKLNMYAEALADEYSVIAIVAASLLSLVLLNPTPLLIAGGLELIWVALAPDTEWFRRRVDRKHRGIAEDQAADLRSEQIEYLASDQIERHEEMVATLERTKSTLQAANFPLDTKKLDRAIDHHLWLMQLENYYSDFDAVSRLRDLDKQIAAAEADAEGVDGRMGDLLRQRVDVLHRRREQIQEFDTRLAEVSDQRRTLEETILLVAESALAGSTHFDEIDEVLLHLETTEEVVLDLHDEDEALEEEIEAAYAATVNA